MRIAIFFLLMLSMLASVSHAGDSNGRYAIKGVGGQSCSAYNEKRQAKAPEVYMYLGWFQGWLSNENRHSEETFDLASWQHTATLLAAIDAYCRQNPKHPFLGAVEGLVGAMRDGRLKSQSKLLSLESEGRRLAIYEATLLRLQNALKDTGDLKGQASGQFDDATQKAIRAYQEREKLTVNGMPDQVVLQRLVYRAGK